MAFSRNIAIAACLALALPVQANTCTKVNYTQHLKQLEWAVAKREAQERDKRKQDRMSTIKMVTI